MFVISNRSWKNWSWLSVINWIFNLLDWFLFNFTLLMTFCSQKEKKSQLKKKLQITIPLFSLDVLLFNVNFNIFFFLISNLKFDGVSWFVFCFIINDQSDYSGEKKSIIFLWLILLIAQWSFSPRKFRDFLQYAWHLKLIHFIFKSELFTQRLFAWILPVPFSPSFPISFFSSCSPHIIFLFQSQFLSFCFAFLFLNDILFWQIIDSFEDINLWLKKCPVVFTTCFRFFQR